MEVLGERIKQLRMEHDISAKELSEKLDVSQPTISLYENGARNPSLVTLKRIAEIFDVSIDYLMDHYPSNKFSGFSNLLKDKSFKPGVLPQDEFNKLKIYKEADLDIDNLSDLDNDKIDLLLEMKNKYSMKELKTMNRMMNVVKEEMELYNYG